MRYIYKETLYANALASADDLAGWRMEGDGAVSFPCGRMRMEGLRDPADGQAANIVHWCPEDFPDRISIAWDFYPIREPGLCILFFAATGRKGEDLFSPDLAPRSGPSAAGAQTSRPRIRTLKPSSWLSATISPNTSP